MREIVIIITLIIALVGENIHAQIVTDRPTQTASSSTVPTGSLQLESGISIGYESNNQESTRQISLPTNLFRYGLANWIELRVLNQYKLLKSGEEHLEGIGDLAVGTKIQLIKGENKNTEMAFLTHLIMPTGTGELTSDKFGSFN